MNGQGQMKRAFRILARTTVVLLAPSARTGRLQSTALVTYAPVCKAHVVWIRRPRQGDAGDGGERERYESVIHLVPDDLVLPPEYPELLPSWRVVRGSHAMTSHQPQEEWLIDNMAPVSEYGNFGVVALDLCKPRKGEQRA